MWHSKDWLEWVLKGHANEKMVQKVISINEAPLVAKGDNYVSDLLKLTAKVVDGSGESINKTYVLKVLPQSTLMRQLAQDSGMFHTELKIFSQVINEMEKLMERVDDWRDPLWCHCIAVDVKYGILLQDLHPLGYKIRDRQKGLDISHAKMAVSALARFHAMSVVLHENYVFRKEDFNYTQVFTNASDPMMRTIAKSSLEMLSDVILEDWPSEWHSIGERVKTVSDSLVDVVDELSKEDNFEFNVLNHGDLWVNNMMFRYDLESGDLCGIRFIDFQLSSWGSPAFDLHYFLTTSIKFELVRSHYTELLTCYHKSLIRTFEIMKHIPRVQPTISQLHEEMERTLPYAFYITAIMLPKMYVNKEDVVNLEEVLKGNAASKELTMKPYRTDTFTKAMKLIFPFFENKRIF